MYMSKIETKETKPKLNQAKTVENIKFEPILTKLVMRFDFLGLIYY